MELLTLFWKMIFSKFRAS